MDGLARGWPMTGLGCCTGACGFEPEATEEDQRIRVHVGVCDYFHTLIQHNTS